MELKKKRTTKKKRLDYLFVFCMLLIPVIHFIVFWVIVNFNSILLSFKSFDVASQKEVFTLKNFGAVWDLLKTSGLKTAMINTLITSGFQIIFLVPWSFVLSYFLFKKIPLTGVWRVFLFLPSILPAIFLTAMFTNAIQSSGPIGKLWALMFNNEIPALLMENKYAKWTVLFYFFLTNFGGQFILFSGAMSRIPKEVLEAGRIDGVGFFREMFKIVLPLIWPTFSMILILNFASVFTATGPILLLTKGQSETSTISYWIFDNVNSANASLYLPATLGLSCTIILYPFITLVRWVTGKVFKDVKY